MGTGFRQLGQRFDPSGTEPVDEAGVVGATGAAGPDAETVRGGGATAGPVIGFACGSLTRRADRVLGVGGLDVGAVVGGVTTTLSARRCRSLKRIELV